MNPHFVVKDSYKHNGWSRRLGGDPDYSLCDLRRPHDQALGRVAEVERERFVSAIHEVQQVIQGPGHTA